MKNALPRPSLIAFTSPATAVFLLLIFAVGTPNIGQGSISLYYVILIFYALYPALNVEQTNIKKYGLIPLNVQIFPVAQRLMDLMSKAGIRDVKVFISEQENLGTPFAFGTFRKNFLVIPAWMLREYESRADEYDAVLSHEIAHIKFGDSWKKELAQSLALIYLGMMFIFFFYTGYQIYWFSVDPRGWLVYNSFVMDVSKYLGANYLLESGNLEQYSFLKFSIASYLDFALICLGCFVVYTSLRILAQSRELFADAFAAQMTSVQTIKKAYGLIVINSNCSGR